MKALAIAIGALLAMSSLAVAQQPSAARAKMLAAPEDPRQKTILVGRSETNGMIVQFEIEPATAMLISRGARPKLVEHAPAAGELYHLEVKPSDPRSKTRQVTVKTTDAASQGQPYIARQIVGGTRLEAPQEAQQPGL